MTRLFKREVSVSLSHPGTSFFGDTTVTTLIKDLRVQFQVVKNLKSEPNTCEITISNLSHDSRAEFQTKPLHVRLDAGYDGELERLFTGDLRWAESRHESVDWETKLIIADGERAHRFARVGRSYKPGVDVKTALLETVKAMGLKLPRGFETSPELRAQFAAGVVLSGPCERELTRLLKPLGMQWSIQDERLQILRAGDVRKDEPILVSQDTGMIGVPELGAPEDASVGPTGRQRKGKPPILTVKMQLYPGLIPGGRIRVKSRAINGLFRIDRVTHIGDTYGDQWESDVEARQI